jgi:sugar lactone lactonase YvrE
MSRQPFARRYWGTLTGDGMTWGAPAAGRGQAGYTFWQRYWAALTMTDLPVIRQGPVSASGMRTHASADKPHPAQAGSQPTADGLDLLDSELRQNETRPVVRERFRMLAPLAAALAVIGVVLGVGLTSHLGEVAGLVPNGLQTNLGGVGISGIAFSPDGSVLAVGDSGGSVELWNAAGRKLALTDTVPSSGGAVNSVAFSPDGKTVAAGDSSGSVELWNAAGGKLALTDTVPSSGGAVNSVGFSPDGRTLAAGGNDGKVSLWNVADPARRRLVGQLLVTGGPVNSVAFSPDGKTLAAANSDGKIYTWNLADPVRPLLAGIGDVSDASVNSIAFSPDGKTLAAANSDGGITLRNAVTGTLLASYSAGASVNAIAFSQDGSTLAAGDSAGSVDLLDEHGTLTATYSDGSHSVSSVAFRRSAATLAAGDSAGQIRLFALPNSLPENLVALAPGLTSTPAIASVEQFTNRYFTAINRHDYAQYNALLDPEEQAGDSATTFNSGFASVADSDITLTAVSESPGQVVAHLTYTSRQDPADSVNDSACNQWQISLYLAPQGSSYLMTAAPPDYHAAYSDC